MEVFFSYIHIHGVSCKHKRINKKRGERDTEGMMRKTTLEVAQMPPLHHIHIGLI